MDLIDDPQSTSNTPEFSVAEISGAVKRVIEGEFGRVRVRGEVGRVVVARTGHMYFDLKDDRAVLACVSWKGQVARMRTRPEEGMEVIATGRMTTFGPQSKYQLQVESVEPAGAGALMAMLEKRRKALAAEGLFDAARKRALPYLPRVIGVVTSPSGAVIRDILHRLRDRFAVHVIVWPVAVQGERCAPEVARAIKGFNALPPGGPVPRPDLLIVARGGGSIEDLWGFNEEAVVRAAAASDIPLISAVGHETDTTLIDHAADRRAPTPTAAAEIAVPVRADLLAHLAGQQARLLRAGGQIIARRDQRLRDLARALPRPETLLAGAVQAFDRWAERLPGALRGLVAAKGRRLAEVSGALRPAVLARQTRTDRDRLARVLASMNAAMARRTESSRARLPAPDRLARALARVAAERARVLTRVNLRPALLHRAERDARARLDRVAQRLERSADARLERTKQRLTEARRLHETLGYTATLARGFAVVRDGGGQVLPTRAEAAAATGLEIEFRDGKLKLGGGGSGPRPRKPGAAPDQGSLF
ncbi:MAG: exodeoxyribonuclease VII large subunit [Rhodobacteraceae bacterium]|nr:exodeoxyribonuclease VII large subunit [Paracoccaceae bacterium]